MADRIEKPLGRKAYGSIPHLMGSRRGTSDKGVNEGQQRICCERRRDASDVVIVQEKLDGSNVAVAKIAGVIVPLIRAGYRAEQSHYRQHRVFAEWVYERQASFDSLLRNGERLCGEWLAQAHGTRYDLANRSPFVAFDLMTSDVRTVFDEFQRRVEWAVDAGLLDVPPLLHIGNPLPVADALALAGDYGRYGARDTIEGVVYRVERKERGGKQSVDFLAKYVRPEKIDGQYLESVSGQPIVWNWLPLDKTLRPV